MNKQELIEYYKKHLDEHKSRLAFFSDTLDKVPSKGWREVSNGHKEYYVELKEELVKAIHNELKEITYYTKQLYGTPERSV